MWFIVSESQQGSHIGWSLPECLRWEWPIYEVCLFEWDAFVLWDCTNGGTNSMKSVAFTAVPNFLPFFQAVLSCSEDKLICGNIKFVIEREDRLGCWIGFIIARFIYQESSTQNQRIYNKPPGGTHGFSLGSHPYAVT